jgi:glycosyltransferase involved in cell wall biosynthesis
MRSSATAIMLVRNEQHILPITVGYLLSVLGVDRVVIADNGSTDSTPKILQRLSEADERCRWLDASGPYRQAEIVNELAREACHNGASWIIPNDADEFFWFGGRKFQDLHLSSKTGAVILEVRNFVQWYWVEKDHPHALETMFFSADPVGKVSNGQQLVAQGQIAFVQIKYPPKLMLRASLTTIIHKGNHDADVVVGDRVSLSDAEVLHAPLRARNGLYARMEKAQRVEELEVQGAQSWHLRRLLRIKSAVNIDDEWKANSTRFGRIGPADRRRRLLFDLRLRRIARTQHSFAGRIHAGLVD